LCCGFSISSARKKATLEKISMMAVILGLNFNDGGDTWIEQKF
jgi:hypothetical protein